MTIGIHVARVGFFQVDGVGLVVKKDNPTSTLGQVMTGGSDHRIIEDINI